MRVLVPGASGLLGKALADALLVRGDEVVGLTRNVEKAKATNPRVNWHRWDPDAERPPAESLEGVDGVVNLIGEDVNQRLTPAAKERIRKSRIDATHSLLTGISLLDEKARPKVFVGQSAVGYYGDRGQAIVDESTPPGDDFLAQVCIDWEAAEREAAPLGMRLAITRTGLVLTKDGGLLKQLLTPFKLGLGGPLAGGDQYMPWIHIDDEIGLFLWALDEGKVSDPLNATAPNPVTNRDFSKALGKALHRPSFMPAPKLAVAALRGRELADVVSGGQRAMPRRALDLGYKFRFPELAAALEDLL